VSSIIRICVHSGKLFRSHDRDLFQHVKIKLSSAGRFGGIRLCASKQIVGALNEKPGPLARALICRLLARYQLDDKPRCCHLEANSSLVSRICLHGPTLIFLVRISPTPMVISLLLGNAGSVNDTVR
jgi:hypothetical protein